MRLIDLKPCWVAGLNAPDGAKQGVSFECPCCNGSTRLAIFFTPTICGNPPVDVGGIARNEWCKADHLSDHHIGSILWQRTGDTFETLTLSPSVDCSAWKHWHGWVQGGECR